jgi:hydroxyethylthiazole kinase-like uncharacterized protein yjeF
VSEVRAEPGARVTAAVSTEVPPLLLLTADEMRAADARTTTEYGVPVDDLMERAGRGLVEAMEERYGDLFGFRVLVACGRGHNGGDGLVAARLLLERGATVHTVVLASRESLDGVVLENVKRLEASGGAIEFALEAAAVRGLLGEESADYAVDALLGTGSRPGLSAPYEAAVRGLLALQEGGTRVVAADLPTGLDADTGMAGEPCVDADCTVTFGYPKRGHALFPGRVRCGEIVVTDIGIPPQVAEAEGFRVEWMTPARAAALVPRRGPTAHKGSVGKGVVIGGSRGLTGAVAMCAEASLSAGLGMVYAATPASLHDVFENKLQEPITWSFPDGESGAHTAASADAILARLAGLQAAAIGPGLGRSDGAAELARTFLAACPLPAVVDADALTALAAGGDWWKRHPGPRVLTPHLGEMSRLTGETASALEARRVDVAREWSAKWGVVLVLKGAPTVTAAPDGRAAVNATGNPGMASAGMGDVLTGAILGFLAQGLDTYDAARLGVFVHGLAADRVADRIGIEIVKASEVEAELRPALAQLLEEGGLV